MFEELNKRRQAVAYNIAKSFENDIEKAIEAGYDPEGGDGDEVEKAHQDGDMHPNGKWVWVSSANGGKGDWRTKGGRAHTKHSASVGNSGATATTQQKPTTQQKTTQNGKKDGISDSANHSSLSGLKGVSNMKEYLTTFNSKYTDMSKVKVMRTPKGNWDVHYDGHRLGIFAGNQVPESTAKKMGWLRNEKE